MEFLLQTEPPRPLLICRRGKSPDPFLENSPRIGSRLPGSDWDQVILLRLLLHIYMVHDGQMVIRRPVGGGRGSFRDREHGMPLSQPPSNAAPDGRLHQILMRRGTTPNKPIQQTILEASQKARGKAVTGQKRVGLRFSYRTQHKELLSKVVAMGKEGGRCFRRYRHTFTVYENLCMVTVRSHQYCFVVYLFLGQARLAIDDFQELPSSVRGSAVPSRL